MTKKNKSWVFVGDVCVNGTLVLSSKMFSTWAPSKKKAFNNLRHRYRMDSGLGRYDDIRFEGEMHQKQRGPIVIVDELNKGEDLAVNSPSFEQMTLDEIA